MSGDFLGPIIFIGATLSLFFVRVVTVVLFVFNVGHGRLTHGVAQFFAAAPFSHLFLPSRYYVLSLLQVVLEALEVISIDSLQVSILN